MTDKNKAIIDYLITCDYIRSSSLYFNFINAKNNTKQIIAESTEEALNTKYIDGTVAKQYRCTLIDFKSLSTNPIAKVSGYTDENVTDLSAVQAIIDWVAEQNELHNYPDFGENCIVENISTTANNPSLNGIDVSTTPALARYSIVIQVDYLDKSKVIWNKED